MSVRLVAALACLIVPLALSGCGGGGGGGGGGGSSVPPVTITPTPTNTPPPGPTPVPTATPSAAPATPTPAKYTLPSAAPAVLSAYSVDSQPRGLAVALDGVASGTTPTSVTPAYSRSTHTITISGSGVATYTATVAQTANGTQSIFYNATVDTQGKIGSISSTSFSTARRAASFGVLPRGVIRSMRTNRQPSYSDQRFVVQYDPRGLRATQSFATLESSHGIASATTYRQSTNAVVRVASVRTGVSLADSMRAMAREPGVASVDYVRLRSPLGTTRGAVYPNDPFFVQGAQWYLNTIDATDAWGYGVGKSAIAVAVIDTGVDPLQTEVAPGVTFSERIVGGSIDASANAAKDTDGHGTFTAGIVSAQTNNGAGFAGVSYGASLQIYKVFTDAPAPTADSADVAEAIREAVAHHANVIVLPLGGSADAGPDPLERDAVAFALASNVAVIAPSGNESAGTLDYPAGYDGVISVGASAINDAATPGSAVGGGNFEYVPTYANASPALGLVAPGGDLASASDADPIHGIVNAYTTQPLAGNAACPAGTAAANCSLTVSGTSAAAAIVAGAAGLLLAQSPALTPAQLSTLLYGTADDIKDARQGHGRLNLHTAAASLAGDSAPFPSASPPVFSAFVAFAYRNSGGTKPQIIDVNAPSGVRVNADGTFRIADIPATGAPYRIAVWADTNGNGIIDAGDSFGVVGALCATSGPCAGANALVAKRVVSGFVLP